MNVAMQRSLCQIKVFVDVFAKESNKAHSDHRAGINPDSRCIIIVSAKIIFGKIPVHLLKHTLNYNPINACISYYTGITHWN